MNRVDERAVDRKREKPHPGSRGTKQGGISISQGDAEDAASTAPIGDCPVVFGASRPCFGECAAVIYRVHDPHSYLC